MPDLPSCFGEHSVQVADSFASCRSRTTQNVVTCLYEARLAGICRHVTITWCKNLIYQGLSLNVEDPSCQGTCKVDMKPWFLWKKKGCKSFVVGRSKVDVFWDLSSAKYGSSPEPLGGFYVAVVTEQEVVLLLGDMHKEAYRKTLANPPSTESTLLSRREDIFGRGLYSTKAHFTMNGLSHEIVIECHSGGDNRGPCLCVRVDRHLVLKVNRLIWKFRGNQTITIDGFPVELFWDVHNWLFSPNDASAVFMFRICHSPTEPKVLSGTSPLEWQQSISCKHRENELPGFSLLLYAWKSE
eukprot:c53268_g1_i1 orf=507-1400(+)